MTEDVQPWQLSTQLILLSKDLAELSHDDQVKKLAEINRILLEPLNHGPAKLRAAARYLDEHPIDSLRIVR